MENYLKEVGALKRIKKFFLDILGFISLWGPWPEVSGEDINNNIKLLKKTHWFQTLLKNEKYRELIIHNNDVRYEIGDLNTNRLKRNIQNDRYRRKIQRLLEKKIQLNLQP